MLNAPTLSVFLLTVQDKHLISVRLNLRFLHLFHPILWRYFLDGDANGFRSTAPIVNKGLIDGLYYLFFCCLILGIGFDSDVRHNVKSYQVSYSFLCKYNQNSVIIAIIVTSLKKISKHMVYKKDDCLDSFTP